MCVALFQPKYNQPLNSISRTTNKYEIFDILSYWVQRTKNVTTHKLTERDKNFELERRLQYLIILRMIK